MAFWHCWCKGVSALDGVNVAAASAERAAVVFADIVRNLPIDGTPRGIRVAVVELNKAEVVKWFDVKWKVKVKVEKAGDHRPG